MKKEVAQMVYFHAKNPIWVNFRRPRSYDHLEYLTAVWYSLWTFGIFFRLGIFGPRKCVNQGRK
jgi:hypothetical protein